MGGVAAVSLAWAFAAILVPLAMSLVAVLIVCWAGR